MLAAVAACAIAACGDGGVRAASPSASASVSSAGSASPATSSAPSSGPPAKPRRTDPAWGPALASEDDAVAAELASRVGAPELGAALDDEAAIRRIALRALPLADRPDQAWGALGKALASGKGDEGAVADAVEGVLARTRRDVEPVDEGGAAACAAELRRIAESGGRGSLPGARAESLARRVGERAGEPR